LLTQLKILFERVSLTFEGNADKRVPMSQWPYPCFEIQPDQFLCRSNAILFLLESGTEFSQTNLGNKPSAAMAIFEQYSHEPYIATSRFWLSYLGKRMNIEMRLVET